MKITRTKFYHDVLLLLLILNSKVLLFGDWDQVFRYITALVSIALFVIVLFDKNSMKRIRSYTKFIYVWLVAFFLYLFFVILYCITNYDISLFYAISQTYLFTYVLLIFPILAVIEELYFWGIISLVIRTINWFLYNYVRIDIMHYLVYEAGYEWTRNGNQRIPISCFAVFVMAYSIYNFLEKKNVKCKIQSVCVIAFVLFYAQFITDARALVLRLIAILGFAFWFSNRKTTSVVMKTLSVILLTVSVALSGVVTMFYNSINSWSITARLQAYAYYFDLAKQYPLTGVTLVAESEALERGPWNYFYFTDIGTVAKFVEYGVIGGILFFVPLLRMIIIALKTRVKKYHYKLFLLIMCLYLISGCISVSDAYFRTEIFALPYVIAIIEYSYYSARKHTLIDDI